MKRRRVPSTLALCLLLGLGVGCSDDDTPATFDSGNKDAATDLASTDKGPLPDGPAADSATPQPDSATPQPDSATPQPDGTAPTPDAITPKPDQGTAPCAPTCDKIGTKNEGWYDCANKLIKIASCKGCTAKCDKVGTKSEGWYSSCDNSLIKWAMCKAKP